jgi:periplasmic divalent cation tolerance protein
MRDYILVISTVPGQKKGQDIARSLVENKLAACVSLSSACTSFYRWEGKISRDQEYMLFIKTREDIYPLLEKKLLELHPYEVPEIIALPVIGGSKNYLKWIEDSTL